jgi:hypothetical protein
MLSNEPLQLSLQTPLRESKRRIIVGGAAERIYRRSEAENAYQCGLVQHEA